MSIHTYSKKVKKFRLTDSENNEVITGHSWDIEKFLEVSKPTIYNAIRRGHRLKGYKVENLGYEVIIMVRDRKPMYKDKSTEKLKDVVTKEHYTSSWGQQMILHTGSSGKLIKTVFLPL